ncbi:MAG: hypothetical protein ACRELG_28615, partial [Gemmataceae bacterium]
DVALPPPVPDNVKRALNLYRVGPRIYPARPLIAAPGSSAEITNIELNAVDSPINADGLHHLNITDSSAVQAFVLARILETLPNW